MKQTRRQHDQTAASPHDWPMPARVRCASGRTPDVRKDAERRIQTRRSSAGPAPSPPIGHAERESMTSRLLLSRARISAHRGRARRGALWDVWPLAYSAELGGVHVVIASRLSGEIRSWPRSDRLLEVLDDCSDEAVEMTLEVGAWRLRERGADSRSARDDIKCRVRQRLRAEVVAPVAGCGTYQVEVRTGSLG